MILGSHLSVSKGYEKMGEMALKIGGNTFQFFTRNPRGTSAKELDNNDIEKLEILMKENQIKDIVAHAPYILNLASYKEDTFDIAKRVLKEDLIRMSETPSKYIVLHPGNHLNKGSKYGIERISEGLNEVLEVESDNTILLETMSGKGTEMGRSFEEIEEIIKRIDKKNRIGVCLDTCHVYSAGYDIKNDLEKVLNEFDRKIGLDVLRVIHLNDSMTEFNSNKDRHEKIGEGSLGFETIMNIVKNKRLKDKIFILETPNELEGYKKEIERIRNEI